MEKNTTQETHAQCVKRNNDFLNMQRCVAIFGLKKEALEEEVKDKKGNTTTIIDKIKRNEAIGVLEQSFRTGILASGSYLPTWIMWRKSRLL